MATPLSQLIVADTTYVQFGNLVTNGRAFASILATGGPTGPQGDPGLDGTAGEDGAAGVAGAIGPTGAAGGPGPAGPAGPAGATGQGGKIYVVGSDSGPNGLSVPAAPVGTEGIPDPEAIAQYSPFNLSYIYDADTTSLYFVDNDSVFHLITMTVPP